MQLSSSINKVYIIMFLGLLIINCDPGPPEYIHVHLEGTVYDADSTYALKNASVKVFRVIEKGLFQHPDYIAIDSTKTDDLGNYSLVFKFRRRDNYYKLCAFYPGEDENALLSMSKDCKDIGFGSVMNNSNINFDYYIKKYDY